MITDMDVVATITEVGWFEQDLIPRLYANGILRSFTPVTCSRWGIEFQPENYIGDLKVVAIHESGHAVIYLEYGERYRHIEINKTTGGGLIQPNFVKEVAGPTAYKQAQAISFAGGPIATSKYLYGNATTWREGALDDFLTLFSMEKSNGYHTNEYVVREASRIVEERWEVIEALADHLLKYGRVRCAECMRIRNRVIAERKQQSQTVMGS